jgi:hypothetical protein
VLICLKLADELDHPARFLLLSPMRAAAAVRGGRAGAQATVTFGHI